MTTKQLKAALLSVLAVTNGCIISGRIRALRAATEPVISLTADATGVYSVRAFGAKGDGTTLDTSAINHAIEVAAAGGGGTVRFPAGTYLCRSIHLKSNITLYLDPGATILAAPTPSDGQGGYDAAEPNAWDKYQDFGHSHWHNSLIWGEDIQNVSIFGPGLIYGKGLTRGRGATDPGVGNKSISLKNCRNITLRDFSILQGGHFGVLATGVDNLTLDNLKIDTNRDGMDIDCCRNVRIANCSVNSPWDDGICLKSSFGLGVALATEDVTITNCQVTGYDTGTFLDGTFQVKGDKLPDGAPTGRIKFGTESNGGFKNITISNCIFTHCRGLALETVDGGLLEDVTITNITMRDIMNSPIFLRLGSRMRGPAGAAVGALRRVTLSNIVVYNADPRYSSIISGIPGHDIEDVRLNNIRIYYQGGGTKQQALLTPPEEEKTYPEPKMFGVMPAYGFFLRHVQGIEMSNVEVSHLKEDARPAFVLSDVKGADFQHLKAQHDPGVSTFALQNVEDFTISQTRAVPDTRLERVEHKEF
ncbi:MAG: glycoside hydrolase family 28 protein [Abitibacteriaceae bacterium]|nr:glycoside hydrolase family 28 protein [Abditibacteriaceae bacterium]